MKQLVTTIALLALALRGALATTYYVDGSSTGCSGSPCSDGNSGTSESTAFATPYGCINKPRR